jgi:hypothetical protein
MTVVVRFGTQLVQVVLAISDFQLPIGHLAALPFMTGTNHPGAARHAAELVLIGGEVRPLPQS